MSVEKPRIIQILNLNEPVWAVRWESKVEELYATRVHLAGLRADGTVCFLEWSEFEFHDNSDDDSFRGYCFGELPPDVVPTVMSDTWMQIIDSRKKPNQA